MWTGIPDLLNIVITGASGFIGRALTARLDSVGLSYTAVSRQCEMGHFNTDNYLKTPASKLLVHLGENPDRAEVNALGEKYLEHSASVVEALVSRTETFIYASSGVVYGDQSDAPFTIKDIVRPTDVYSRSKILNETITKAAGGTVLRLSNLYGKGMSTRNVISDITRQLPYYGPMKVRNDVPVRDFLCVNSAVNAILMLTQKPYPGVLNLGSGIGMSIGNLALLALSAVGQKGREIVIENPSASPSINILDISMTKTHLGWSPGPPPALGLAKLFRMGMT
jgi:UDP-glucose 4-epimerase